ncbi:single-stranded nucleic acid binding R3H domain-containing protein [Allomyces macrogynus ATCC 38327]|uniref:Single-stranded nucleic acid binding R3H domain-containing protein n=1 Tax=Allomyces macrogynus (strain ATCC 38327) TaxID=578462 RepID=A0A0L0SIQ1_ALLM3|nr:single-stranded nucleic acid binding R3H domain-containing protein [Allomyces macrogynus ATCC 38327]|eukprot:KNE62352.1 single-stranded nucleic acid binding R3H domain-containing protein [Allomyces macrogynus ATCC 38327]
MFVVRKSACPTHLAFLRAVCCRLARRPDRRATLGSLQDIVGQHPSAQSALGGVKGLAREFPQHVRVDGKTATLLTPLIPAVSRVPRTASASALDLSKGRKLSFALSAPQPTLATGSDARNTNWDLVHSLPRCDICLVSTAAKARGVQRDLAEWNVAKLAMDMEGCLQRNEKVSIDVIQLGVVDMARGKPIVFPSDFARVALKQHMGMVAVLRSISNDKRRTLVVHAGKWDIDVLKFAFDIQVQYVDRIVDTQLKYQEWAELSVAARAISTTNKALKHCAPSTVDPARTAGLYMVMAACGLQANEHMETMTKVDKKRNHGPVWPKYWDLHKDRTLLLEHAAFDVDQLVQEADILEMRIKALKATLATLKKGRS